MGFFDKFFEKKVCSICGGDIGLLGNRKLEDGDMCKECAKKLSPWFQDQRESSVAEIQAQLAYREENLRQLQNFKTTRVLGGNYKMYIEEVDGIPVRFYVSNARNPLEENPDIISFQDVGTCMTDIHSRSSEVKEKNNSGEWVSKSPREFKYSYTFYMVMSIRNIPYWDQIKFCVDNCTVFITESAGSGIRYANHSTDPVTDRRYRKCMVTCQEIEQFVALGKETSMSDQSSTPKSSVRPNFCPNCGTPAGSGNFCANCGQKLI